MNKFFAAAVVFVMAACVNNDIQVNSKPSAATSSEIRLATAAISEDLKDPFSAKFKGWQAYQLSNGNRVICGEVNAKNSFGAYVGFKPVYVRMSGKKIFTAQTGEYAGIACWQAAKNVLKIASSLG